MVNLTSVMSSIGELKSGLNEFISDNKTALGIAAGTAGGIALGAAAGALVANKTNKKRSSNKRKASKRKSGRRIKHTKRGWAQDRRRKSKQKWEVAYRKHKKKHHSKSRKGKHYTKNGQPYIILASGKARFVKK